MSGLKEISQAGAMADRLREAAQAMFTINNTYGPRYDELLAAIQAAYPGKAMADLTDAEVNAFFFGGLGSATAIANAKAVMAAWEPSITSLAAAVITLPANDI